MKQRMEGRGLTFVDLRPILSEASHDGPVYRRNDTHWNMKGALVAFNAATEAAGRPDLVYADVEGLLFAGATAEPWDGDLVRMLGLSAAWSPDMDYMSFPGGELPPSAVPIKGIFVEKRDGSRAPSAYDFGQPGPRIMVIGDFFTNSFWRRLLSGRASAMAWMHHSGCAFDQGAIERFGPDILFYVPVERNFPCSRGPRFPRKHRRADKIPPRGLRPAAGIRRA